MAPLVFLRPCSRGYCLELRDIQPSGLNVRSKIRSAITAMGFLVELSKDNFTMRSKSF